MNSLAQKKLVKLLVASHVRSEIWIKTEELKQLEPIPDKENTISKNISKTCDPTQILSHVNALTCVIAEYHRGVKKMTLKDKSLILGKNILPTLLSKTLDQDSILGRKGFKPFWNTRIEEYSTKLWLPTKTDCVDSGLNYLRMFLNEKAMLKSWFSTKTLVPQNPNLSQISYKFSQFLAPKSMDLESISCLSKKIKIYPNPNQTRKLKDYIGCYRKIYNLTVQHIRNLPREKVYTEAKDGSYIKINDQYTFVGKGLGTHKISNSLVPSYYMDSEGKEKRKNQTSLQTIRPIIMKKVKEDYEFKWFRDKNIPVHLIDRAVDECSSNFSTIVNKIKATGKYHELHFKNKRKSSTETIDIEAGMFSKKRNTIFATTIGMVKSQEDFYKPKRMAKLQYNRNTKEWFLIFSNDFKEIKTDQPYDIVSIDPGEKIFLCLYCPDKAGHVVSICEDNRKSKIFYKLKRLDKLISKRKKTEKSKRTGLTRAIHRIYKKIKNMKSDMHHKASLFICKNYKNIVLPTYESKPMMSNLNNKVCRSMSTLSFYEFKQKLKYKSQIYGCNIFDVNERCTSVSCGNCGLYNIPNDREYFCFGCKTNIHRDYNGARNILLKHL